MCNFSSIICFRSVQVIHGRYFWKYVCVITRCLDNLAFVLIFTSEGLPDTKGVSFFLSEVGVFNITGACEHSTCEATLYGIRLPSSGAVSGSSSGRDRQDLFIGVKANRPDADLSLSQDAGKWVSGAFP